MANEEIIDLNDPSTFPIPEVQSLPLPEEGRPMVAIPEESPDDIIDLNDPRLLQGSVFESLSPRLDEGEAKPFDLAGVAADIVGGEAAYLGGSLGASVGSVLGAPGRVAGGAVGAVAGGVTTELVSQHAGLREEARDNQPIVADSIVSWGLGSSMSRVIKNTALNAPTREALELAAKKGYLGEAPVDVSTITTLGEREMLALNTLKKESESLGSEIVGLLGIGRKANARDQGATGNLTKHINKLIDSGIFLKAKSAADLPVLARAASDNLVKRQGNIADIVDSMDGEIRLEDILQRGTERLQSAIKNRKVSTETKGIVAGMEDQVLGFFSDLENAGELSLGTLISMKVNQNEYRREILGQFNPSAVASPLMTKTAVKTTAAKRGTELALDVIGETIDEAIEKRISEAIVDKGVKAQIAEIAGVPIHKVTGSIIKDLRAEDGGYRALLEATEVMGIRAGMDRAKLNDTEVSRELMTRESGNGLGGGSLTQRGFQFLKNRFSDQKGIPVKLRQAAEVADRDNLTLNKIQLVMKLSDNRNKILTEGEVKSRVLIARLAGGGAAAISGAANAGEKALSLLSPGEAEAEMLSDIDAVSSPEFQSGIELLDVDEQTKEVLRAARLGSRPEKIAALGATYARLREKEYISGSPILGAKSFVPVASGSVLGYIPDPFEQGILREQAQNIEDPFSRAEFVSNLNKGGRVVSIPKELADTSIVELQALQRKKTPEVTPKPTPTKSPKVAVGKSDKKTQLTTIGGEPTPMVKPLF